MDSQQQEKIFSKPFWTFPEIIDLAMSSWLVKNKLNNRVDAEEVFKADLLDEFINAVNTNEITALNPKLTQKSKFEGYITPVKIFGSASAVVMLAYALKYVSDNKEMMQEILRSDPNFDPLTLLIKCSIFLSLAVVVRFLIALIGLVNFAVLYLNRNSPRGMISYLTEYAKHSGLAAALYESGGVINFLNSRYELGVGEGTDGALAEEISLNDEQHGGLPESAEKPANPELIKKMNLLNELSHKSRNAAKDAVKKYIEAEMQPPCCCLHSQMVHHVSSIAKKQGGPISLKYRNSSGEYEISTEVLRNMTKEVYEKIDPARIQTKNAVMPTCSMHPIRRR